MNVCLFGGSFDPIHCGHLAIARAAADRFGVERVLLCPAQISPFKQGYRTTPYLHRYAMTALAALEDERFMASDLESPEVAGAGPSYTIDTVRRLKAQLASDDRLFFLSGADAFLGLPGWREADALLRSCEFIVAARPGYTLQDLGAELPQIASAKVHLMEDMHEKAVATEIRQAWSGPGDPNWRKRFLPTTVATYIQQHGLYQAPTIDDVNSR